MIQTKKPYSSETIQNLLSVAIDAKKSKVETLDSHLNHLYSLVQYSCLDSIKNKVFDKKDYHSNDDYIRAYAICDEIEQKVKAENDKFANSFIENKLKEFTYPYYLDVTPSNYNDIEDQIKIVLGDNPYNIARQQLAESNKDHLPEYAAYITLTKPVRDRFFSSNKELIQKIESILTTDGLTVGIELSDDLPQKINSEKSAKLFKSKM
jgi:hypothetical protein